MPKPPKTRLLQSGVLGYEALLDLSGPRHEAYCAKHGYTYLPFRARTRSDSDGIWDMVDRIVQVLEESEIGDLLVAIDADSYIHDTSIPLHTALPSFATLGMVPSTHIQWLKTMHPNMDYFPWDSWPQFVSGGSWTRKCPQTLDLWKAVQQAGPTTNPMGWRVQATLMKYLSMLPYASCFPLDPMWYAQPYHPNVPNPVIYHPVQGGGLDLKLKIFRSLGFK